MVPALTMVKFFTQTCPMCLTGMTCPPDASKCLCVVKGRMVPARRYVEDKGSKEDENTTETLKDSSSSKKEKSNEERFFTEIAKRYLEDLKKAEDQLKKKPDS